MQVNCLFSYRRNVEKCSATLVSCVQCQGKPLHKCRSSTFSSIAEKRIQAKVLWLYACYIEKSGYRIGRRMSVLVSRKCVRIPGSFALRLLYQGRPLPNCRSGAPSSIAELLASVQVCLSYEYCIKDCRRGIVCQAPPLLLRNCISISRYISVLYREMPSVDKHLHYKQRDNSPIATQRKYFSNRKTWKPTKRHKRESSPIPA